MEVKKVNIVSKNLLDNLDNLDTHISLTPSTELLSGDCLSRLSTLSSRCSFNT